MTAISDMKGVMAAIASPCDENEVFQEETFSRLAEYILTNGQHGLYVCGGTGDGFGMTLADRKRAAELAVEAGKKHGGKIIVHVGATSTRDAVDLAVHAAEVGADAVSSMPPPMKNSQSQLVSYYGDIARTSGLPTIIYYVPALTNRTHTIEEILGLLDVDGVIGMKFSDMNYFLMQRFLIERPDAVVFTGWDELLCPGMQYGSRGGIGLNYNLYPKLFRGIYDAMKASDVTRAMELQSKFIAHMHVVFKYGLWQSFDALMRSRGYGPRVIRRPRDVFDADTEKRFLSEIQPNVEALLSI